MAATQPANRASASRVAALSRRASYVLLIPRPAAQDQPRRPGLRAAFGRMSTGPTHRTRDASKGPRRRFGKKGQTSPLLTVDGVTPSGVDLHADSTESIAGPLASARPRCTHLPPPEHGCCCVCWSLVVWRRVERRRARGTCGAEADQFAEVSDCPCMDLESIDRSASNPLPSVRVHIGSASQTLLARGGAAGRIAGRWPPDRAPDRFDAPRTSSTYKGTCCARGVHGDRR